MAIEKSQSERIAECFKDMGFQPTTNGSDGAVTVRDRELRFAPSQLKALAEASKGCSITMTRSAEKAVLTIR